MIFAGCSLSGPIREDKVATGYRVHRPSGDWAKADWDVEADHIYINESSRAVLNINSVCERYANASLKSLLKAALSPLNAITIVEEKTITLDDREALQQNVKAKLDGVSVELLVTVLRKDHCIFDFQMQRAGSLLKSDKEAYQEVLDSFRYSSYGGKYDSN